jgi:outer membrane protein OmpA-like peptidoglycan-associated protein
MNANKSLLSIALAAVVLGGCSTEKPSPIEFNYQIDNARANGIVQVFDLRGDTVVQIRDFNAATTHFYDQRNVEIPHRVVGENVVHKGIQASFTVSSALAASRIVRTMPVPLAAAVTPQPAGGPIAAGASSAGATGVDNEMTSEQLQTEIARIKKEIAALKMVIASASAENAAARPVPAAQAQPAAQGALSSGQGSISTPSTGPILQVSNPTPLMDAPHGNVIRVCFKDNSHYFAPKGAEKAQILDLVKKGAPIAVTGYTDSSTPTPTSEALAKSRADAAKRYLIRRGIDGKKISIDFVPAGKFISENESEAGKAANRRVEIRSS